MTEPVAPPVVSGHVCPIYLEQVEAGQLICGKCESIIASAFKACEVDKFNRARRTEEILYWCAGRPPAQVGRGTKAAVRALEAKGRWKA